MPHASLEERLRTAEKDLAALLGERDRHLKDFAALQGIYSLVAGEPDLEKTLKATARKTAEALGAHVCAFLLYDEGAGELVVQPGAYGLPEGAAPLLYRVRLDNPLTSSGRAFQTGEPFLSADAQKDPGANPRTAKLWNYRSLIVAPLFGDGKTVGVMRVGHREPGVFARDHLRLAVLIAEHAAVVIQNARLYDQSRRNMEELRRLNNAKTDFLSMVSHELQSPLATVKSFLNIFLEGETGPLTARQRDFLVLCRQSLDRVGLLIEDLLDVSRIEAGVVKIRLAPVQVRDVLEAARKDHVPGAKERGVFLKMEAPKGLPDATADPHRVRQVVDNFLSNALKFTPEKGVITLSAHALKKEVSVSVRDTGVGIPEAERERIFDRFYQVDHPGSKRARGTGLGLAICKSLVEHMGGRIWVESSAGKGSDFRFTLPLHKPIS